MNQYSYDRERSYYSQRWPEEAKPYLHLEPYLRCWLNPEAVFGGKRVLDIGAGECTYTRLIAERFGPKEIVACELFQERMLPAARVNQSPNLRFVAGDTFKLPLKNGSFDVVFGTLILSQLPNLEEAISEIARVCSHEGFYIGIEPNPFNPVILYRYFCRAHSPNQYLFWPWRFGPAFRAMGFRLDIRYFYAKWPAIKIRWIATCIGIQARLSAGEREGTTIR